MTIAYLDCFAGISGDMTLGALVDAGADRALLEATIEALRLGDEVAFEIRHETRGHSGGTRVVVEVSDRVERTVPALRAVVEDSGAPDAVKARALDAIDRLARAESAIHQVAHERLHLHELGGGDTLVDIVGVFWLLQSLDVEKLYASALPMSRPAPATLRILEGTGATLVAVDKGRELVTPTGAAILAAAATFERPSMTLDRIGYGVGANEAAGNTLAVWIGQEAEPATGVAMVETNLDDMAPNLIAPLIEDLMAAGALDVTLVPALMKKGRPGHVLTVMSPPELVGRLSDLLLRRSSTLGVRVSRAGRLLAGRRVIDVRTELGMARIKVKEIGGKAVDVAPEFEDCRKIAIDRDLDLRDVIRVFAEAARAELEIG
jgi:uncharacterized protein (TIGR00299 family) protein